MKGDRYKLSFLKENGPYGHDGQTITQISKKVKKLKRESSLFIFETFIDFSTTFGTTDISQSKDFKEIFAKKIVTIRGQICIILIGKLYAEFSVSTS